MKNLRIFLILALLIAIGIVGFMSYRYFRPQETIRPKRGDIVESIYGLGTVSADKTYRVRAALALSIQTMYVKEGDEVKKGDPLVRLDDNLMKSPIDGTVTGVAYKVGELVTPQMAIVTVTNRESLSLEVSLEQQSVLRIKAGQEVFVSFESLRNERWNGVVKSVYPRESQFIVRIELARWPQGVLPGMTADVAILVGERKNALLIPLRSLLAGQVMRIRDGKKEKLPVRLGIIDGEWGEVLSENVSESDDLLIRK